MKLQKRRVLSLVLAFAMMFTTFFGNVSLTAFAAEGAGIKVETLEDGDEVVLYHPTSGTVMTTTANGKKLTGCGVDVTDGVMSVEKTSANADLVDAIATLEVSIDENGYISFLNDGKYLTTGATGGSLTFEDAASDYSLWTIDENGIKNVNAAYNGNAQYMEYYNGYTTYGYGSGGNAYVLEFYTVPEVTEVVMQGEKVTTLKDGSQVVMYNPANNVVLSTTADGSKLSGVKANGIDEESGRLFMVEGADYLDTMALLDVAIDENGYYTFTSGGKYLTSGATGNGLSFADEASDYSLWAIDENGIKNVNAAYNGNAQYLEFYKTFTTYGYNANSASAYVMEFYTLPEVVAAPVIEDGTYVIYNPGFGMALSSAKNETNTNYNAGVAMTLNEEGTFDEVTKEVVWTVKNNPDGTIEISMGSNVLSMDTQYASTPFNKVNDKWSLTVNEDGTYYINNEGRGQSLQWRDGDTYNYFSGYYVSDTDNFKFNFIPAEVPVEEVEGIVDGTYVIYNPEYKKALSTTYKGYYNYGIDYTLTDGVFSPAPAATEVWTITNNEDGTITISCADGKLSLDESYTSMPLNKVNDTWTLEEVGEGVYYIKNTGRGTYIELSSYGTYDANTFSEADAARFALQIVPVSEALLGDGPKDGDYFFYHVNADTGVEEEDGGVMHWNVSGGCAPYVVAKFSTDGTGFTLANDGEGAGVFSFERQMDGTYLIKRGTEYLGVNDDKQLVVSATIVDTDELSVYWVVDYNDTLGGYTIGSATVLDSYGKPIYMEYYPSNGFCAYGCNPSSLTDLYVFQLLDTTGYADEDGDGYVGEKPATPEKPVAGQYVIYNASGAAVMGGPSEVAEGSAASFTTVSAEVTEDGITVSNGGLIFNVTVNEEGYYTFENNGKYLTTNEDEELFLTEEASNYTQWNLAPTIGGFIMENREAKWKTTPIVIEFFSSVFQGWTYKAVDAAKFIMNFYPVEDTYEVGYVVNPQVVFNSNSDANQGVDYVVDFKLDDLWTVKTVTAEVTFDGTTTKEYDVVMDGLNGTFTIPQADFVGHTSAEIVVSVESEETTIAKTTSYEGAMEIAINDDPIIVSVTPGANAQTGTDKRPSIVVEYANIGENATFELLVNGKEVTTVKDAAAQTFTYQPEADMADGKVTVKATITRADEKVVSKEWSFTIGEAGVKLYFGQMHSHTSEYSDGSGTLEQAFEYAMNTAIYTDYMIVTDHSNYFDTTSSASKESAYDAGHDSLIKSETTDEETGELLTLWEEAQQTAEYYDSLSDDFVAGFGYEMTWSGGPGHINVFNSLGIVSRNNAELNNKTNNAGMLAFYDLMVDANAKEKTQTGGTISGQFNHPGVTFGTFDTFTGYTEARDEIMNLIEVGNGDGAIGSGGYFPSYQYYDQCLSLGWHVAPTNNQDNHKGLWGDANTARTVILTDDFTEAGLYEAMAQRHVYSTEDHNLSIIYYLEEVLQGGIIDGYDKETVNIKASISDENAESLGYVYVIGQDASILYTSEYVTGNSKELDITLDNTSAYYYIKVVQKDGDIAVTAPVWVADVNENNLDVEVVISYAGEADGEYPVVGEAEELTAVITNNEDAAVTLESYTVTADGEVIASNVVGEVVEAEASYELTCEWTPETYGTKKIEVSYVLTKDGQTSTSTFSKNIYVAGTDYDTVVTVADAKAGEEGQEFTIEGIVTANASGFDTNTAFFDCIYVQDATGGINVFPVAGNFEVGQKVRLHGAITYYNGEIELNISDIYGGYIEIIEETKAPVAPQEVTCADAMLDANIGLLMQVEGKVTRVHEVAGVIDRIYVEDETGVACIYINGYIWNSATEDYTFGTEGTTIQVGDYVQAVGIGSVDVDELGEVELLHRLRVRDRVEINVVNNIPDGLYQAEDGTWYYYVDGEIATYYTGLVEHYGAWFYVENGILNWNYTGLVQHYDAWFYVQGGQLDWGYTGLVQHYDAWFYVNGGQLDWSYTGLVQHYDAWFYVQGGQLNWGYTGLVEHYGAWFFINGGQLDWSYTGLAEHYGAWFFINGGQLDWSYTGLVEHYGAWFYVNGGQLDWSYTGLVQHYDAWFYVNGGQLDWSYTGLCEYNGILFYIYGGQLNWGYTGTVEYNGELWYVENGIAVRRA